ncbi:uncharacterized protein VNE69_11049 [Vairimorpha necatrix]|uniref:Uncharacterized protein n=1 Tax=Vairimorpha necatrix TaxID=6039 RepID=A0AAX4JFX8_9MICR
MDFFNAIIMLLFVRGYQIAYNNLNTKIINKIENKDYREIDNEKMYLRVKLSFDNINNLLKGDILREFFNFDISEEDKRIIVFCGDKTIKKIVEEFEEKLNREFKKIRADYIILIYGLQYYTIFLFQEIVNFMYQINILRKGIISSSCVLYEYIIEDKSEWNLMLQNVFDPMYNDGSRSQNIPLTYRKKEGTFYIYLCINLHNVYYLFEIDVEEIYQEALNSWAHIIPKKNNEMDKINDYTHKLYKNVNIDNLDAYPHTYYEICTIDVIKFNNVNIKIEIADDKIYFVHKNDIYCNILNWNYSFFRYNDNTKNKWILQFEEIFKRISKIYEKKERCIGIDMFFRLIEYEDKVIFFIERILYDKGSPLYVLLMHLMLFKGIINKIELNDLLNENEIHEIKKNQFCSTLKKELSKYRWDSTSFTIVICLFIQAENYINKNNIKENTALQLLYRLGALINLKANEDSIFKNFKSLLPIRENKIDLIKIHEEIVLHHLDDIIDFQKNVREKILKIATLFTGHENNKYEIYEYNLYTKTDDVIHALNLDANKVEINNEIINKKLFKNTRERKTLEEIKNLLQKINEKCLNEELNKIKHEILNKKIENIYDDEVWQNFEDELIGRGDTIIDKIFNYKNLKHEISEKYDAYTNKEYKFSEKKKFYHILKKNNFWIEEYKTVEKEKLHYYIRQNLSKKIIHDRQWCLIDVLVFYFDIEIINDSVMRKGCEGKIKDILKVMNQEDVFEAIKVMSGINLHDCLVDTMKNK